MVQVIAVTVEQGAVAAVSKARVRTQLPATKLAAAYRLQVHLLHSSKRVSCKEQAGSVY